MGEKGTEGRIYGKTERRKKIMKASVLKSAVTEEKVIPAPPRKALISMRSARVINPQEAEHS